ncbi:D-alanyl-D-alanine carboxypeptidase [Streptomyces spiralis]|uniref:D-alanyl-D-alanine carboxypeptidase n=1 Tax=Streptomyces spiralis TaxID=66376 RepID=UPI0036A28F94
MEEASVAGESPDRSKQGESSAEPTSGSAGPVPEARGEARDVRDPRLAPAGESGTPEGHGGVDTATRVLSVRDLVTDGETDGEEDSAEAVKAEKPENSGKPENSEKADKAEEPEMAESGGKAGNSADSADVDAEAEAGDDEAAASGEGDHRSEDGAADGERADVEGDARLRAAVAAWVGSGDAKKGTGDPEKVEETAEKPEPKSTEDTPEAEEAEEAEEADTEAEAEAEADTGTEAGDDAAQRKDTPEPAPKREQPKREQPKGEQPKGELKPEPPVDQPTAVFKAPRPEPAVDQPTAVFKAPRPKPAVDQPTTMLKLGGEKKDDAKAGKKSGEQKPAPKAGESDVERTSKFVALKPLDAPETRKSPSPSQSPSQPKAQPQSKPAPSPAQPQPQPGVRPPAAQTGLTGLERTTQQPLPPKPPLDLLAELTNTPPPPETPLRTAARRVKIWTPLIVLLAIVFAIVQAVRPLPSPTLALTAKDSYTFNGGRLSLPWPSEGQGWMDGVGIGTMDHFGNQTPVAIGSVAKTMTAYIILRDHPLKPGQEGPKIQIDATAEKEGGYDKAGESTLNTVKAGDYLTEKQALSAVMIPSANNIARLLARWDVGSEAAFVRKMNDTARELGMTHTTYTDPSGLKETTVSTAEDQVKLGNAFVKVPALVAITGAASWTDPSGHYWTNYNELPYRMGAIGIKTGSTTAAGGNLLFASRKQVGGETVTVVGAILGQHKPKILETANAVSKTALLAAQEALTSAKILKKGDVVGYVDDQLGGHTPVVITKDVTAVGWAGLKAELSLTAGHLPHSAKAGTKVGTLTVGDGAQGAVRVPVALQSDLAEPGFADKLTRIG